MAFLISLSLVPITAEGKGQEAFYQDYDIVFDGIARKVELIEVGSFSNAVENGRKLEDLEVVVSFRVVDIHKSDQSVETKEKRKLPSFNLTHFFNSLIHGKFKESVKRSPLGVTNALGSRWFRIAVVDAYKSFGIVDWHDLEPLKQRIYLKRYESKNETYVMVRNHVVT